MLSCFIHVSYPLHRFSNFSKVNKVGKKGLIRAGAVDSSPSSKAPLRQIPLMDGIGYDKINLSNEVEALILVKLRYDYSGYTVPHLVRFLKKFYKLLSKQALIKRVHRALDKLQAKGLVITQKICSYRFARLTKRGLKAIPEAVDLICFSH